MDRNDFPVVPAELTTRVALRKESVDRNDWSWLWVLSPIWVALRKESVDRNVQLLMCFWPCGLSLSARRAWIEIEYDKMQGNPKLVALRKESVDRNVALIPDK